MDTGKTWKEWQNDQKRIIESGRIKGIIGMINERSGYI